MSAPLPLPAGQPTEPAPETRDERLKRHQFYLSAVSTILLICGGFGSIYQYFASQKKQAAEQKQRLDEEEKKREERAQRDYNQRNELAQKELAQREREAKQRRREYDLLIYREKKEAYATLLDAAAAVATARNRAEAEEKAAKYWGIHFGRAHFAPKLDIEVVNKKMDFGNAIKDYLKLGPDALPKDTLNQPLVKLAITCQESLDRIKLDE